MIKSFRTIFRTLVSLTAVLTLSTGAAHAASPSDKSVAELMELSGISKQIAEFPNALKQGFAQASQQGQIPPNLASQLQQQIDISLNEGLMLAGIEQSVQQKLSGAEVDKLLTWYRSDNGRKITAEEKKASEPAAQQEMMTKARELMQDTPRVKMAQRINQAAGVTDITVEMQKQVSVGIFAILSRAMQPEQEPNLAGFKIQLNQIEPQLRQQLDQVVTLALVYTYRNLQPETVQAYENFLIQPATKKFNRTVMISISDSIEKVVLQWAANMSVAAR